MAAKSLAGQTFGYLLVLSKTTSKVHSYRCLCTAPNCGKRLTVRRYLLIRDKPKSHCGCQLGITREQKGLCGRNRREYSVWRMMIVRCTDPKHVGYKHYGARGIRVCPEWQGTEGFKNFLEHIGPRPRNRTLDRIDVNGNYEPGNVRWATWKTQAQNKRRK